MRITIDTKHDSDEELRHAIQILASILKRQGVSTQAKTTEPTDATSMMSMFSASSEKANENPEAKEIPDTPPDFSAFLNLTDKREIGGGKKDKKSKIEFF